MHHSITSRKYCYPNIKAREGAMRCEVIYVRTLAAKSEDPNSVSETQRPEKTDSYKFFSGYHMCAMVCVDSQMHSK